MQVIVLNVVRDRAWQLTQFLHDTPEFPFPFLAVLRHSIRSDVGFCITMTDSSICGRNPPDFRLRNGNRVCPSQSSNIRF